MRRRAWLIIYNCEAETEGIPKAIHKHIWLWHRLYCKRPKNRPKTIGTLLLQTASNIGVVYSLSNELFPMTLSDLQGRLDRISSDPKHHAVANWRQRNLLCTSIQYAAYWGCAHIHTDILTYNGWSRGSLASDALSPAAQYLAFVWFLANVNSRSRSLYAIARPSVVCLSVVCLSVTFVRPTQAIDNFGNISAALGTLAIHWHPPKILRRSSQGNPSAGGVEHKRGSKI